MTQPNNNDGLVGVDPDDREAALSDEPAELTKRFSIGSFDNYVDLETLSSAGNSPINAEPSVDSPSPPPHEPSPILKPAQPRGAQLSKKRIIFIRHAQSTWNAAAEHSQVTKVSALTKGIFEAVSNKSKVTDGGKYIDAPLSNLGILQSMDLNRFIQLQYFQHSIKEMLGPQTKGAPTIPSPDVSPHKDRFRDNSPRRNSQNECVETEVSSLPFGSPIRRAFQKLHEMTSNTSNQRLNTFVKDSIDVESGVEQNEHRIKARDKMIEQDLLSLMGTDHSSCVVTSNLRRAIDTAIIGLSIRWQTFPLENMYILSALQEFGKGPDCYSKTDAQDIPKISQLTQQNKWINLESLQNFYQNRMDSTMNYGPKKDDNVSRFDRMLEFCRYAFNKQESTIIVVGHSIWFQRFCKIFLLQNKTKQGHTNSNKGRILNSAKKNHISISSKIYNAGCVGFDLCRIIKNDTDYYGIDARTMTVNYRGFEKTDKFTTKMSNMMGK